MGIIEDLRVKLYRIAAAKPKVVHSEWDTVALYSSSTLGDYLKYYKTISLIRQCINLRAAFATSKGFFTEIESLGDEEPEEFIEVKAKVDEMNRKVNLDEIVYIAGIKREIFGYAGFEIVKAKKEPVKLNPLQSALLEPHLDENWNLDYYIYDNNEDNQMKPEDIFFVGNDRLEGDPRGLSMVQPVVSAIKQKMELDEDILAAAMRMWAPFVVAQVDTSMMTEAEEEAKLNEVKNAIEPGVSLVTNKSIEFNVVNMTPDLQSLMLIRQSVDEEILGNFGIPKPLVGREKCALGSTVITDAITGAQITLDEWYMGVKPCALFTLDDDWKIQKTSSIGISPAGTKKCLRVTASSGRTVDVSDDHPFFTLLGWRNADTLTLKDRVAVPRHLEYDTNVEIPDSDVKLLAAMISEGHAVKYRECIATTEVEYQEELSHCIKERMPNAKIKISQRGEIKVTPSKFWELLFSEYDVLRALSLQKETPPIVFSLSKKQRALFLAYLYRGDGSLYQTKNRAGYRHWRIDYSSISEKLVFQVQHLLLTLGIQSFISSQRTKYKGKECSDCFHVIINRPSDIRAFIETVKVPSWLSKYPEVFEEIENVRQDNHDSSNAATAPAEIWKLLEEEKGNRSWYSLNVTNRDTQITFLRLQKMNGVLESTEIQRIINADIYFESIISIEDIGEQNVYDVSAPPYKNWIANNWFVISNSLNRASLEYSLKALRESVVTRIQRTLKREIERQLYSPVVASMGLADKVRIKHTWNPISIQDFIDMAVPVNALYANKIIDRRIAYDLLDMDTMLMGTEASASLSSSPRKQRRLDEYKNLDSTKGGEDVQVSLK